MRELGVGDWDFSASSWFNMSWRVGSWKGWATWVGGRPLLMWSMVRAAERRERPWVGKGAALANVLMRLRVQSMMAAGTTASPTHKVGLMAPTPFQERMRLAFRLWAAHKLARWLTKA